MRCSYTLLIKLEFSNCFWNFELQQERQKQQVMDGLAWKAPRTDRWTENDLKALKMRASMDQKVFTRKMIEMASLSTSRYGSKQNNSSDVLRILGNTIVTCFLLNVYLQCISAWPYNNGQNPVQIASAYNEWLPIETVFQMVTRFPDEPLNMGPVRWVYRILSIHPSGIKIFSNTTSDSL